MQPQSRKEKEHEVLVTRDSEEVELEQGLESNENPMLESFLQIGLNFCAHS